MKKDFGRIQAFYYSKLSTFFFFFAVKVYPVRRKTFHGSRDLVESIPGVLTRKKVCETIIIDVRIYVCLVCFFFVTGEIMASSSGQSRTRPVGEYLSILC